MWTIGSIQLEDFIKDNSVCAPNATLFNRDDADFAQTYVAVVSSSMHIVHYMFYTTMQGFGYGSVILWTLSIWWTLKSTLIYRSLNNAKCRGGYEQIQ